MCSADALLMSTFSKILILGGTVFGFVASQQEGSGFNIGSGHFCRMDGFYLMKFSAFYYTKKILQIPASFLLLAAVFSSFSCRYFTFPYKDMTLEEEMKLLDKPDKMCHFLAHNGWVMNDDPLRNFAEPGQYVKLFRIQ